ncbi:hypothetical protein H4R34_004921 [Dimargaris verticillata]|uniref:Reverse transcriptase domain-containing protein n=1 Tax=Dimargaris verticillata TaxID=2761393 RepID=A0A9W8E7M7_9FUNG|nr:hypothetical protein H4R34_004921 [Dimargaris verticillata]
MDKYVATQLRYGIDEPGTANANVPVYSLLKPNTNARRVILDNSLGSTINMQSIGIDLPRTHQVRQFMGNAKMVSSIDLASDFTTIRIKPAYWDFYTFNGGAHDKVRATRLVQGNSQSLVIAQALLIHIFGEMPKLLGYIDSIYLKSSDGNVVNHIADISEFVRKMAQWNLQVNMAKSIFLATTDVDILGYHWTNSGSWSILDYHVASLQNMPMPTTVKAIQ